MARTGKDSAIDGNWPGIDQDKKGKSRDIDRLHDI